MLEPFAPPAMRLALLELLLLSVPAGLLGAQVALRRMAFFTPTGWPAPPTLEW